MSGHAAGEGAGDQLRRRVEIGGNPAGRAGADGSSSRTSASPVSSRTSRAAAEPGGDQRPGGRSGQSGRARASDSRIGPSLWAGPVARASSSSYRAIPAAPSASAYPGSASSKEPQPLSSAPLNNRSASRGQRLLEDTVPGLFPQRLFGDPYQCHPPDSFAPTGQPVHRCRCENSWDDSYANARALS